MMTSGSGNAEGRGYVVLIILKRSAWISEFYSPSLLEVLDRDDKPSEAYAI
jgi:hypothetical protein